MTQQALSMKAFVDLTEGSRRIRTKSVRIARPDKSGGAETPEIFLWAGSKSLFISADLRGINLADLQICVTGSSLIFRGSLHSDLPSGKGNIHQAKRASGTFSHALELPYRVEVDHAEVQNENGLVSILLKREESRQSHSRDAQSSFMNAMLRFFCESGDDSNHLKDEITILETLERYLEYQFGKGFAR